MFFRVLRGHTCQGCTGGQVPSYFHTYNLVPQLLSSPAWTTKHPSWSLSSSDRFKPVSPILPPEPERHAPGKRNSGRHLGSPEWTPVQYPATSPIPSWPVVCIKLTLLGLMAAPHPDPGGQRQPDASSSSSGMKLMA